MYDNNVQPGRRIAEYLRQIEPAADGYAAAAAPAATLAIPAKLYRVSEIAQHLGLTRQTVHNYATIGLITEESQTPGGQRLFDESVFGRLVVIRRLKRTHRLSDIRRMLEGEVLGGAPGAELQEERIMPGKGGRPTDGGRPDESEASGREEPDV